jgi:hypothetical protein
MFAKVEKDLTRKIDDLKMHIKLIEMQNEDLRRLKKELAIYEDLLDYVNGQYNEFATPEEIMDIFQSMKQNLKERL